MRTATRNIASEMTSLELAVVLERLAKIEQKQDKYQSNFLNSSAVMQKRKQFRIFMEAAT